MKIRKLESRPMCAVCGKPVDEMLEEEDEMLRRVTFTAVCHGQRERVTVNEELVESGRVQGFGTAFANSPRRLPEAGS